MCNTWARKEKNSMQIRDGLVKLFPCQVQFRYDNEKKNLYSRCVLIQVPINWLDFNSLIFPSLNIFEEKRKELREEKRKKRKKKIREKRGKIAWKHFLDFTKICLGMRGKTGFTWNQSNILTFCSRKFFPILPVVGNPERITSWTSIIYLVSQSGSPSGHVYLDPQDLMPSLASMMLYMMSWNLLYNRSRLVTASTRSVAQRGWCMLGPGATLT